MTAYLLQGLSEVFYGQGGTLVLDVMPGPFQLRSGLLETPRLYLHGVVQRCGYESLRCKR